VNLKEATITNVTPSEITIIVPSRAQTGKIDVYTNLADGAFLLGTSSTDFTVPAPVITTFPAEAFAGEEITINGNYFSALSSFDNTVKIGILDAEVISATGISLVIKVPVNAITGKISIKVGNQTTESTTTLTIK
jgi:hypothetical protein